ncbi:MAG: carboxypeptidase regulatory-like domain-containing protein [Candidatus Eremiobacteraeota bacterium]|nr:carboxypeptidase regulatory-like domain-containing protein [Candidatus Eremiobacteraeota bacterium]
MAKKGLLYAVLFALFLWSVQATQTLAGTTGNISGVVTDNSGRPVAGARVTAASPSQTVTRTSDAKGFFSFLNLSPDTYTITAAKAGLDTATTSGITVQADQNSNASIVMAAATKTIGRVVTTAQAGVVSKTVTGDLYAVNAQAINSAQGSSGGAETLYSQNSVVGSLPGVVRTVGSGGGYFGQGTLSLRGGAYDQVGYELDGVPLNRGFDFYNGTAFVTNGLSSLEVYTGGAPADAGRAMSGYINQVMQRGKYPGGSDLTLVAGGPTFNHIVQADTYGGNLNNRFTYYISTLALNSGYSFNDRSNDNNISFSVPANDAGCPAFTAILNGSGTADIPYNCGQSHVLNAPISQGVYGSNGYGIERDSVANLHWTLPHNGLDDDLQALYVMGYTSTPQYNLYSGQFIDPSLNAAEIGFVSPKGLIQWPTGALYQGSPNQPYNPANTLTLTWPSSGGSTSLVPPWYKDAQSTQYSIEKLGYTRALTNSSFLRLYGYELYSFWGLDQATEGIIGGTYYQLHDNATGVTANYQNQLNSKHLLKIDADYSKDLTLRYNYGNYFSQQRTAGEPRGGVVCGNLAVFSTLGSCTAANANVAMIRGPYAYWSDTTPIFSDAVISDQYKMNDKLLFDLGLRYDQFRYKLMPLALTGANGIAQQSQNQFGICLHGYAYAPSDPCFGYLNGYVAAGGHAADAPGAAAWSDVSGDLTFHEISPRFGVTFTAGERDVLRFSVGRYVQPPNSAFQEYKSAPYWGVGDTVAVLNRYYDGLGFLAVHNVQPEDSTNYDLSFEHDFNNGLSAKLTPYYRNTRGQVLNLPVNPAQPSFVTGYNFGAAKIRGLEFLLRKNRTSDEGLSGSLSATVTDSKIRFTRGFTGTSFIDTLNGVNASGVCQGNGICGYNAAHGTNYALLDPNGFYYPSFTQAPTSTSASYVVPVVATLSLDYRKSGFDLNPTFNYQSGYPYGDPGLFPDPSGLNNIGPNPYTNTFDAPGSLKGPAWLTMNMGLSHDIGKDTKASVLMTNVFTSIWNHGYPWELPSSNGIVSYADNTFYQVLPLGYNGFSGLPSNPAYLGDNYYPYAPTGIIPAREFVFSVSKKF